ncbi:TetR/AcrR family transcriptional regulator [Mycobacterium marinum]|uniref:Transcriptional regulatory protein (Probably TetR-family) n=3 Tax=Mycobacterium ulcerans group TaxID=2993898 RepID=B2HEZ9_MYCMM|nr:TetR/AcrR family transcriptional regulator [Mycobacterium marinum]ACC41417.1 transcriptional regulatory protein (probably TetR-family) [Mycobacterium marinum M]MDC8994485.1 TetR/AcrR family transcriptional regulator [Mycobacterium marinum]MDC9000002.1 TetR/AcrR family transcriptional regulator [Mycobacterium marinum]MDC9005258.1 TetR/AcrR family transcriptional regulator [Mycobacterium marinum]MDC9010385.1 TetR/AcrR family transcriptional regulator [Mycobacterium marinum]
MESTAWTDQPEPRVRSQGRPRDARIDAAVLRATTELLEEIGYARLTIPLVAARAGATPPAVYRRFPTKIELVYEAVFPNPTSTELPLTDGLESGIRALLRAAIDLFSRPAVHSALSGLMAELPSEPGLSARLLSRLQSSSYGQLQRFLDHAAASGQATPDVDARILLDMIGGTVMMALANERDLDAAWMDHTTTLLLGGLAR